MSSVFVTSCRMFRFSVNELIRSTCWTYICHDCIAYSFRILWTIVRLPIVFLNSWIVSNVAIAACTGAGVISEASIDSRTCPPDVETVRISNELETDLEFGFSILSEVEKIIERLVIFGWPCSICWASWVIGWRSVERSRYDPEERVQMCEVRVRHKVSSSLSSLKNTLLETRIWRIVRRENAAASNRSDTARIVQCVIKVLCRTLQPSLLWYKGRPDDSWRSPPQCFPDSDHLILKRQRSRTKRVRGQRRGVWQFVLQNFENMWRVLDYK